MIREKKTRKRLAPHEAEALGFDVKSPIPTEVETNTNPRYYLTIEQHHKLIDIRKNYIGNTPLSIKGTSTLKDGQGNVLLEWVKTDVQEQDRLEALRVAIDALKEDIEPAAPLKKSKKKTNSKLINQYLVTDMHLAMLAWGEEAGDDYDMKVAEDILINFFTQGIESSPNADEAILAQLGDFLHFDGLQAVTPMNKHILDADTRFTKLVRTAIRLIRSIISMLLAKYNKVTLIMAEGNHDMASSVWLREVFHSFYAKEPRLTVDTNPDPYYCVTFGKVCLFYHHGHLRNLSNIDSVLVAKFKEEFGNSKFVFAHTGHKHHKQVKETNLMILEQHRTLSAKDSYASRGGWISGRDASVITYHKEYGEVSRQTINIDILR